MHHNQAHLYSQSGLWRITCLTFACYVLAAPSFAPPLKAMLEVATTQVWMTVFSCFMKGYQQTLEQLLSLEKLNECDELPAFELEAPFQGKWRIFLAKPGIYSIWDWRWGAIWVAFALTATATFGLKSKESLNVRGLDVGWLELTLERLVIPADDKLNATGSCWCRWSWSLWWWWWRRHFAGGGLDNFSIPVWVCNFCSYILFPHHKYSFS